MAHSVTEKLVSDKTVTTIIFLNFLTILALGFLSLSEDVRLYLRVLGLFRAGSID